MPEVDLSKPWEEVEVTVHYSDRGVMATMTTTVNRTEMEEAEKAVMISNAEKIEEGMRRDGETPKGREMAEGWRARADRFTITDEDFKAFVLQQAGKLASSPLQVPGRLPGSVRILPPWAVKEVTIEPKGISNIITLPS